MLKVKNIEFSYEKKVLDKITFQVNAGQFVGLVGKSGGGKSTLLKIIGGFLTPSSGQVFIDNVLQKNANDLLIPGYKSVAFVHQDFGLDLYHTVTENIREKVLYLPEKIQFEFITELLELLGLTGVSEQKAIGLSGGEQQRLSIARALASESDLVLLDEPFVHLDSPMRLGLVAYLNQLKEIRKTSFIIVTHNGEEILGLCDEVIYLKKGRISRKATPEQFYDSPKTLEEGRYFGHLNSILHNGESLLFRPNQYSLKKNETAKLRLDLNFEYSNKLGPIFHNCFRTLQGEEIILFNFESMEKVKLIYV